MLRAYSLVKSVTAFCPDDRQVVTIPAGRLITLIFREPAIGIVSTIFEGRRMMVPYEDIVDRARGFTSNEGLGLFTHVITGFGFSPPGKRDGMGFVREVFGFVKENLSGAISSSLDRRSGRALLNEFGRPNRSHASISPP